MIDSNTIDFPVRDAMYWEELGDMRIKCVLCPRECQVADLERGYCGVRENKGGRYYTLVHSKVCALHIDAIKIDLKSFTEKFYRNTCNGKLKPVLDTLVTVKELGIWLEIVVLIIPTLNDSSQEIRDMCRWIKTNLGSDVPIHFTRYYPTYKIKNIPPTPLHTLERARQIAIEEGFNFAYVGNVPGHEGENTYCSNCKELIIKRTGFQVLQNFIEDEKCQNCNSIIPGTWNDNSSKSIYHPKHRPWKGPWSLPY